MLDYTAARPAPPASQQASARLSTRGALIGFVRRLHLYIGLLIGPFFLLAAGSGMLYAVSPQIEAWLYAPELRAAVPAGQGADKARALSVQIKAAERVAGIDAVLDAVRPAPAAGQTTRVMFETPNAGASMRRAIFIDPITAAVRGDLAVYGTSGALPWRTAVDQFHRSLWLGDIGRIYSELAASWLWLAALGGLVLWSLRRVRRRPVTSRAAAVGWHTRLGPWLLLGLLFLSVTGLTWSQYAGERIGVFRAAFGWQTPSVSTQLAGAPAGSAGAEIGAVHHHELSAGGRSIRADPAMFDRILAIARRQGIDAQRVEIRPPASTGQAWTITEIDRGWPTQVDSLAIDGSSGRVVDARRFADYPLAAKLTRWGIDAHMGVLFGWPNQLLLLLTAAGLIVMVVLGYVMTALRWRSEQGRRPALTMGQCLWAMPVSISLSIIVCATVLGWALPVLGASLLVLVVIDGVWSVRAWFRRLAMS